MYKIMQNMSDEIQEKSLLWSLWVQTLEEAKALVTG